MFMGREDNTDFFSAPQMKWEELFLGTPGSESKKTTWYDSWTEHFYCLDWHKSLLEISIWTYQVYVFETESKVQDCVHKNSEVDVNYNSQDAFQQEISTQVGDVCS